MCRIFHDFCRKFVDAFYHKWIYLPTGDELKEIMDQYDALGFTGAVGSTDVTHVAWGGTPFNLTESYKGKEGYCTIAFEATVDHSGRVLGIAGGFPGAQNDKTIVHSDGLVASVRNEPPYSTMTYKLKKADGTESEEEGAYLIVDGGYHNVSSRTTALLLISSTRRKSASVGLGDSLRARCYIPLYS